MSKLALIKKLQIKNQLLEARNKELLQNLINATSLAIDLRLDKKELERELEFQKVINIAMVDGIKLKGRR